MTLYLFLKRVVLWEADGIKVGFAGSLSKCFLLILYSIRGCSKALTTFSHFLGSLASSSLLLLSSSSMPKLDMPKLCWLSSLVRLLLGRIPSRVLEKSDSCRGSIAKLFCRLSSRPVTTLPPVMFPSSVLSISLSSELAPSTMTPPLRFFQPLAASSSTFSAKPSSRHPEPQCLPMKVASSCKADEVSVRLCFLVKVRNASGRRVAGGRRIGKILALGGGGTKGFNVCAGVPNAGEEDGIELEGSAGFGGLANMGAVGGLRLCILISFARNPRFEGKLGWVEYVRVSVALQANLQNPLLQILIAKLIN